ncbi:MAG: hypothetical protein AB8B93_14735 [Pseudomonadales bacterium]
MAAPIPHRFLLVRCEVENSSGESSLRYVEHNQFRLWQYLMVNRHNIMVHKAGMALWLPQGEWQERAELFDRAGASEVVMRLHLEIFDPQTGLCDVVQRFVPEADLDLVSAKLEAMLPATELEHEQCIKTVETGQSVIRQDSVALDGLGRRLTLVD